MSSEGTKVAIACRAMSNSLLLSSAALLSLLANFASSATDMPTTCYVINGKHTLSAGFRCNNQTTGHSSCCAIGGICYSNGVCQQSNSGVQDYLRVGCTDHTWQDPACLDQCTTCLSKDATSDDGRGLTLFKLRRARQQESDSAAGL